MSILSILRETAMSTTKTKRVSDVTNMSYVLNNSHVGTDALVREEWSVHLVDAKMTHCMVAMAMEAAAKRGEPYVPPKRATVDSVFKSLLTEIANSVILSYNVPENAEWLEKAQGVVASLKLGLDEYTVPAREPEVVTPEELPKRRRRTRSK